MAALAVFGVGNGGLDIAMNAQGLAVEQQAGRPHTRYRPARIIAVSGALAAAELGAGLTAGQAAAVIAGYTAVGIGLALVAPLVFAAVTRQHAQAVGDALASVATMGYAGFQANPRRTPPSTLGNTGISLEVTGQ